MPNIEHKKCDEGTFFSLHHKYMRKDFVEGNGVVIWSIDVVIFAIAVM